MSSLRPASAETIANGEHALVQDGPYVFKAAVAGMSAIAERLLGRVGGGTADVDWFVPHQANLRIIEAVARRVGVPMSRVMTNIERYGNTCAATIPSCLSEWHHAGRLRRGHHVVLASFGAGFTMAAASVRWAVPAPMSAPEVRAMPVDRQEILTAW